MTTVFGKRDGYSAVGQSEEEDVCLLGAEGSQDSQATFDFRQNGVMDHAVPGPSSASNPHQVTYSITPENGRHEYVDMHEGIQRQYSLTDYQTNVETEENLKCIVSSLLFLAIIVTVFLVAFLINPSI